MLLRRVNWLSTTVTKTMYVCCIWLSCRRFHLEEGVTMTRATRALHNKIRLADCKLGFDACSDTRFLRL